MVSTSCPPPKGVHYCRMVGASTGRGVGITTFIAEPALGLQTGFFPSVSGRGFPVYRVKLFQIEGDYTLAFVHPVRIGG